MKKETKKRGYRKRYSKYLYLLAGKRAPSETETWWIRDWDSCERSRNYSFPTIWNWDLMNKGLRHHFPHHHAYCIKGIWNWDLMNKGLSACGEGTEGCRDFGFITERNFRRMSRNLQWDSENAECVNRKLATKNKLIPSITLSLCPSSPYPLQRIALLNKGLRRLRRRDAGVRDVVIRSSSSINILCTAINCAFWNGQDYKEKLNHEVHED